MMTRRTIECPACHLELNLPAGAEGRKLKCPRCQAKFKIAPDDGRSPSSTFLLQSTWPTSSPELPRQDDEETFPTATRDLRDTFGLPLLNEVAEAAGSRERPASSSSARERGDALALFEDHKRPAPRRPNPAEARARARRCPTCGGVVPAGMSLCAMCGLDLETGQRVAPAEDLMPEEPPRPSGPPLDVAIFGGVCGLASLILALAATLRGSGWQYFLPVCAFGLFASIQFLRGRSARLLLTALSIGALVDVAALVAMPIVEANMEPTIIERTEVDQPDAADVAIAAVEDRLDTRRLGWGLGLLLAYPVMAVYLSSPAVRRHCRP